MTKIVAEQCLTCIYFKQGDRAAAGNGWLSRAGMNHGICRVLPPQPVDGQSYAKWRRVHDNDWCAFWAGQKPPRRRTGKRALALGGPDEDTEA